MENNLPAKPEPTTDLSPIDMDKINAYIEAGMPGLFSVDDSKMARMMDLYLSGKPYTQISRLMRLEKPLVMYLSQKFNWFLLRQEYLYELEATMRNRVIESKIVSQDFLLQLTQVWQKKIGKKINEFLRTDDDQHASEIDLKEVEKYLKTVEMIHKISAEPAAKRPSAPAVGLNLGEGVTITKMGDNSVEITPKQKAVGDLLKQFADSRRESELKKESDIKEKESKKENKE